MRRGLGPPHGFPIQLSNSQRMISFFVMAKHDEIQTHANGAGLCQET
jgi:hypothetical protein